MRIFIRCCVFAFLASSAIAQTPATSPAPTQSSPTAPSGTTAPSSGSKPNTTASDCPVSGLIEQTATLACTIDAVANLGPEIEHVIQIKTLAGTVRAPLLLVSTCSTDLISALDALLKKDSWEGRKKAEEKAILLRDALGLLEVHFQRVENHEVVVGISKDRKDSAVYHHLETVSVAPYRENMTEVLVSSMDKLKKAHDELVANTENFNKFYEQYTDFHRSVYGTKVGTQEPR